MLGHAQTKQRWPNISNLRLIGIVALWGFIFDFVIEGLFLMPMGLSPTRRNQVAVGQRRHLLPMATLKG
jgi:hypothetical protein